MTVPEKPSLEGLEQKWSERWESAGTYRFDRSRQRDEIYAIDTPPPTVSGSLHVGHVFSFTHTDCVARFHRMRGLELWYPMGWDDNGLPTERRVQNYFGVRCDPSLPYDPNFKPPPEPPKVPLSISRPNFVELCLRLTAEDEKAFEDLWRHLGLSVDWTKTYTTIGRQAQRTSQRAFLRNLARGEAYSAEAPTLWDIDFKTAVAQAELEDRDQAGALHRIAFHRPDGSEVVIETTRPELLPACVAVVAHPDDDRYRVLFGTTVTTARFGADVPVVAHELADPEKGTGLAMICTFGDVTDVVWWRELGLPVRSILQRDGRLQASPPDGLSAAGQAAYEELAGKTVKQARTHVVEQLRASGELRGDPTPITHAVKFYEKGDRPLEIVTSRQWFIRTLEHRDALLGRGKELRWHPPYMQARYESWIDGLNSDWLISRQRFFGVPFPLWYRLDDDGAPDHTGALVPDEDRLPVDPTTELPDGYTEAQRNRPGGFAADPDIMDTWATSSLTPQIAAGWVDDPDLFARLFPMNLRPQGHDIIRTWLFATVVRSHLEHDSLPWSDVAISGWILDPERKKMSKSKGNVITPMALLTQYGSDAVRYWACSARPGTDTAFDEGQMRVGRRLAIKILNASRFVLRLAATGSEETAIDTSAITVPLDRAMLARLAALVDEATAAFEGYDYARALERTESFFWFWCDNYLELVKGRAYGAHGEAGAASAQAALRLALSVLLRLFAPSLPFVTEEVWSWWQPGSIHRAPWPDTAEFDSLSGQGDSLQLEAVAWVLGRVRSAKSERKLPMPAPVARVCVEAPSNELRLIEVASDDLKEAGNIADLELAALPDGSEPSVEVEIQSS